MSKLIIADLPIGKVLDKRTMGEIRGGNSATATANGAAFATGGNPFTDVSTNAFALSGSGFSVAVATASAVAFSFEKPLFSEPQGSKGFPQFATGPIPGLPSG
jgi:hypothetical protein